MGYILETERLMLREFILSDHEFIIRLLNSPGWLAFIGDRNVRSEEEAKNYLLNGPIKSYKENGFGLSLVELKGDKTPIGMCGIIKRDDLESPDIGFAFLPEYTGMGYALEIARAVITLAKETLGLSQVMAITLPSNLKSINVLEKIGLSYRKKYVSPVNNEELFLFNLNPL